MDDLHRPFYLQEHKGLSPDASISRHSLELPASEKKFLLTFSATLNNVKTKVQCFKAINYHLKNYLNFKHATLFVLNREHNAFVDYLQGQDMIERENPFRNIIGINKASKNNRVNSSDFKREVQPVLDFDKISETHNIQPFLNPQKATADATGLVINLYQDDAVIAYLVILCEDKCIANNDSIKLIANLLSAVLLRLKADEKLNRQFEEINNYKHQLEEEKVYLKHEIETTLNYGEIVGESPVMQKTFRLVAQVATSDSTVLILGETGTGKELIARAIHNNSPRKNKMMVKVNCAALPANLIESELFGHERGSFTGATERRLGKFELANNGTIFLDEIGEMPLELQVKLLRVLQEKEIERVGGSTTIKVNVRVIAATNRDLEKEMQEGRFRLDLYYRLNIFPIELPPLRHRKEDIPLLALYFIERFAKKAGKNIRALNNRALQDLVQYKWPGNIRELGHLMERSVLLAPGDAIKQIYLPAEKQQKVVNDETEFVTQTIDEHESEFILKTLKYCNGRIGGNGGAAMILGVPTSTLNSKIKRLGIHKEHITR